MSPVHPVRGRAGVRSSVLRGVRGRRSRALPVALPRAGGALLVPACVSSPRWRRVRAGPLVARPRGFCLCVGPLGSRGVLAPAAVAAVRLVETGALEDDPDAAEDLAYRSVAGRAPGERIVLEGLHDIEVSIALVASIFVRRHAGPPVHVPRAKITGSLTERVPAPSGRSEPPTL